MVLLPVKQYYPQTDSATGHGDRMCFSSTCAMAIKYLRPDALKGSNADDDYLRTVLKYGDTTLYFKVMDENGRDIGETNIYVKQANEEEYVAFNGSVLFQPPATPAEGKLKIYQVNEEGVEVEPVEIPVRFR